MDTIGRLELLQSTVASGGLNNARRRRNTAGTNRNSGNAVTTNLPNNGGNGERSDSGSGTTGRRDTGITANIGAVNTSEQPTLLTTIGRIADTFSAGTNGNTARNNDAGTNVTGNAGRSGDNRNPVRQAQTETFLVVNPATTPFAPIPPVSNRPTFIDATDSAQASLAESIPILETASRETISSARKPRATTRKDSLATEAIIGGAIEGGITSIAAFRRENPEWQKIVDDINADRLNINPIVSAIVRRIDALPPTVRKHADATMDWLTICVGLSAICGNAMKAEGEILSQKVKQNRGVISQRVPQVTQQRTVNNAEPTTATERLNGIGGSTSNGIGVSSEIPPTFG